MSSLRNAVKRRTHKERAQPVERRKYGLLEKHKDYVLRAKDFHQKEKTLKDLRLKASFRNPDEFYFKMQNSRTKGGVHLQPSPSGGKKFTEEELALMRTQDRGYVLTKLQAERKKVDRLQASLHGLQEPPEAAAQAEAEDRGKIGQGRRGRTRWGEAEGEGGEGQQAQLRQHIVFPDSDQEEPVGTGKHREREEEGEEGEEGEGEEGLRGAEGGSDGGDSSGEAEKGGEGSERDSLALPVPAQVRTRSAAAAYRELEMRKDRAQRLLAVLQEMELQRALAGKGRKRKIVVEGEDGESTKVYKWANQRAK